MTEKLKTLLHDQATLPDFTPVDLGAITEAGDRRVRRRGLAVLGGGLAVTVAVGAAVTGALGGADEGRAVDPAESPYGTAQVVWAERDTIHYGERTIDVGRPIESLVHTAAGFVFVSQDWVWSLTDARPEPVGDISASVPVLIADADGDRAGWVEGSGDTATLVVLDVRTGETTRVGEAVDYPLAIDGGTAYWGGRRTMVATDLATLTDRVVGAEPDDLPALAAEDRVLARADQSGVTVTRPGADDLTVRAAGLPQLSPDARWLSVQLDLPSIFDARTGAPVPIDVGERALGVVYAWLDADTALLVAARSEEDDAPVELLTCEVPDGTCAVSASLGTMSDFEERFLLPVGQPQEAEADAASATSSAVADPSPAGD